MKRRPKGFRKFLLITLQALFFGGFLGMLAGILWAAYEAGLFLRHPLP